MSLRRTTLERIHAYWARSLGCDNDVLTGVGGTVVPGRVSHGEVRMLVREPTTVVVAPPDRVDEVRRRVDEAAGRDVPDVVAALGLGNGNGSVRGPQFLGYADETTLRSTPAEGVRKLTRADAGALARLRAACSRREWSLRVGGFSFDAHSTLVGRFVDGRLVAVAAHGADAPVAGIGVVVHPDHRRIGHGSAVVGTAARDALDRGLVPEYRAHESWHASVGLARGVGFVRYGTYAALDLDGDEPTPGIGVRSTA